MMVFAPLLAAGLALGHRARLRDAHVAHWISARTHGELLCESRHGERMHCDTNLVNRDLELSHQHSAEPCTRGQSWGTDATGVWVDHGCRAAFRFVRKGTADAVGPSPTEVAAGPSGIVSCDSFKGRWTQCRGTVSGEVLLQQQRSESPCIRHETWDVDERGLWVSQNCRADFRIIQRASQPAGSAAVAGPAAPVRTPAATQQMIHCESDGTRRECAVDTGRGVRLLKESSAWPCNFGRSWGYEDDRVWVSRGCKGDFVIDTPPLAENAHVLRCESQGSRGHDCKVAGSRAVMRRQLSHTECVEGKSWWYRGGVLHVERGCRAEFGVD